MARVAEGADESTLVRDLVQVSHGSPEEAPGWVRQALNSFSELLGQDAGDPAHADAVTPSPAAAPGTDYRLLGQTLRIDADPGAHALIQSLLGGLRAVPESRDGAPEFWLEVREKHDTCHLQLNGEPFAETPPQRLAPEVEKLIYERMLPRAPHFLAFHAAALAHEDRMVVFPAPAGSGKTTLSAALIKRGWAYSSDEMAILDRSLQWRGVPLPPCVKSENYGLIRSWYPELMDAPEHDRHGRKVRYLRVPADEAQGAAKFVVFPRFEATARTTLETLQPFAGLGRLLQACVFVPLGFEESDVSRLLAWHAEAMYFTLTFSDAADATRRLEQKVRETLAAGEFSC